MRMLAALLFLVTGIAAPAAAGEYSFANRPQIEFPGPRGGSVHISPFPMGKRAQAIWASDSCWRDCGARCAWRYEACSSNLGHEVCLPHFDACERACLKACRTRGGPLLNITD